MPGSTFASVRTGAIIRPILFAFDFAAALVPYAWHVFNTRYGFILQSSILIWVAAALSLAILFFEAVYTGVHHNERGWRRRFALPDDTLPTPQSDPDTDALAPKWDTLSPSTSNATPAMQTTALPYT